MVAEGCPSADISILYSRLFKFRYQDGYGFFHGSGVKEMPIDVAIFFAAGDFPEDASKLVNMSGGSDIDPCCRFDNLDSGSVVLGRTVASSRVSITNWPVGPEASFPSFISTPCTRMEMVTSMGSPEDIALRLKVMRRHEW